ncbi:MAG TPA: exo-alpha-sialidase, partial [Labilithrix sp.]
MRRLLFFLLLAASCKRPATEEVRVAVDASSPASGGPPGIVVDHVEASTRTYVGSPSLAILPDGTYVASHDFFGPGSTEDRTVVFGSSDRGVHWSPRADFRGQWWSTLFVHGGALYILGTSKQFGHVVIRRSSDGGRTWTTPDTPHTGKLTADAGFHCAPTPVVEHDGRIWRAFEHTGHGHADTFDALVVSAPVGADLLDAASWKVSAQTPADTSWLGGHFVNWLEGNVVVGRDGKLVDVLRVNATARDEHAAIAHVAADGASLAFDANADFAALPGASKKFTIRFDPKTSLYFTLANSIPPPAPNART